MRQLVLILAEKRSAGLSPLLENIPAAFKNNADTKFLLLNEGRQGMGGNQKVAFAQAIREKYDAVVVVRERAAAALSSLTELLQPIEANRALGCVFGIPSNTSMSAAVFTHVQNWLAHVRFRTWNSVCQAYSVPALAGIAFALNTNRAHFDVEVALQLIGAGAAFADVNVPVRAARGPSFRTFRESLKAGFKFRLQKWNLFYDVRFHPEIIFGSRGNESAPSVYHTKIDSKSPHSILFEAEGLVPEGARVLDIGSASGYVADELVRRKHCTVTGVDVLPPSSVTSSNFQYRQMDLETQTPELAALAQSGSFDVVLMLDVLEHMAMPEKLLLKLSGLPYAKSPKIICSTANVAFIVVRLMLLFGHFNYGQKGILDITHKRLFSVHTFRNLMEQTGFVVEREHYFPFPFRELGFSDGMASFFEKINLFLIKLRPRLFAYQIMLEVVPLW